MTTTQTFRALHRPGHPLVLPNAWDPGSARLLVQLGAAAVATTSAGAAWSQGLPDGGGLDRAAHLELGRSLAGQVAVPVSLDVEDGCSEDPSAVAALLLDLARAGVAGVNLEDSRHGTQLPVDELATTLRTARAALEAEGLDLFLNARVDSWLLGGEAPAAALERAHAYATAGADGVFLPGLADLGLLRTACERLPAPVNVMLPAGALTVGDLAAVGVARVSTGMWLPQVAWAAMRQAAERLLRTGTLADVPAMGYAELNAAMLH